MTLKVYSIMNGRSQADHESIKLFTSLPALFGYMEEQRQEELVGAADSGGTWGARWRAKISTLPGWFTSQTNANVFEMYLDSEEIPVKINRDKVRQLMKELKV